MLAIEHARTVLKPIYQPAPVSVNAGNDAACTSVCHLMKDCSSMMLTRLLAYAYHIHQNSMCADIAVCLVLINIGYAYAVDMQLLETVRSFGDCCMFLCS